jgi:DNA-binding MarR family transcriptional regulator
MSKASRITYLEQLNNGNLERTAVAILDYIYRRGKKSTDELRNELIYPHQTLTACLSSLSDFGLINVVETITSETNGRKSTFSVYEFVSNEFEQLELQEERHLIKAKNWLKGYDKFKDVLKVSLIQY